MTEPSMYPELPENGVKQAELLIQRFKDQLTKVANDVISDLYVDIAPHIESDSWTNYRVQIITAIRGYSTDNIISDYDLQDIRQGILKEHRRELINDLNQDLIKEVESLKEQIDLMNKYR